MVAWYNENDPAAAHILCHMIEAGVIAPGVVDDRSIKDVQPDDLEGFTQCHFFAGGGFWSVAARLAGWPDDEPIWTASCPCQPFSAAGQGRGTDDPRHLWPDLFRLWRARRPVVGVGEQVAGKAGYGWFDGVRADLAGEGYASRSVDFPACGVDAPHQRNRQYWCALADDEIGECRAGFREAGAQQDRHIAANGNGLGGQGSMFDGAGFRWGEGRAEHELRSGRPAASGADASDGQGALVHGVLPRLEGQSGHGDGSRRAQPDRPAAPANERERGEGLQSDTDRGGRAGWQEGAQRGEIGRTAPERSLSRDGEGFFTNADGHRRDWSWISEGQERQYRADCAGHLQRNGTYWSDAEWIICHDGKARRAQSGLRFLVDGLPGRVDLWRVGGNAIVPQAAQEVIGALIDAYGLPSTWRAE